MTESGVIASRCGGRDRATNSWLMPANEMPTMPTRPVDHGCAAMVSIAS